MIHYSRSTRIFLTLALALSTTSVASTARADEIKFDCMKKVGGTAVDPGCPSKGCLIGDKTWEGTKANLETALNTFCDTKDTDK
ncbi:MAG: hypothetical protein RL417_2439 [Pseudomonadota bacterium]|jgi:hypothetical protein